MLKNACWICLLCIWVQTALTRSCYCGEFEDAYEIAKYIPSIQSRESSAAWSGIVDRFPDHPRVDEARLRWAETLCFDKSNPSVNLSERLFQQIIAHDGVTGLFGRRAVLGLLTTQLTTRPPAFRYYQSISVADQFLTAANSASSTVSWAETLMVGQLRSSLLERVGRRADAIRSDSALLHRFRTKFGGPSGRELLERDTSICNDFPMAFNGTALTLARRIQRNAAAHQPPVQIPDIDHLLNINNELTAALQAEYRHHNSRPLMLPDLLWIGALLWLTLILISVYFGQHQGRLAMTVQRGY